MIDRPPEGPRSPRPDRPRAGLVEQPTRLEAWHRFASVTGIDVLCKRDDELPLGLGGNKVRKLDLLLGGAIADGVDTVLTTGGSQSNHCRLTAAAAARLGMRSILFLRDEEPTDLNGNLLLDAVFGAEIRFVGRIDYAEVDAQMAAEAERIAGRGGRGLVIPLGGANALGTSAYVDAVEEVAKQLSAREAEPRSIVVAAGTGSTVAGIWLGARRYLPGVQVIGVSVSWTAERLRGETRRLGTETADLLGEPPPTDQEKNLLLTDDYVGSGYTAATAGARHALHALARSEGVLLDLTYTAKGLHGLLDLAGGKKIEEPILFWHTGGVPELFARDAADLFAVRSGRSLS